MTDASVDAPLEPDPFEMLKPRRSVWSVVIVAVVALLVAGTVWVSPSLTTVNLQSGDIAGGGTIAGGMAANVLWTSIQVNTIGGVTVEGIDAVGPAEAVGTWVLDELQTQQLDDALAAWGQMCAPDGVLVGVSAACQLPAGAGEAPALLQALVGLGAPLDTSTALPKHLSNGLSGSFVVLWSKQPCDAETNTPINSTFTLRTKRLGIPSAAEIILPCFSQ